MRENLENKCLELLRKQGVFSKEKSDFANELF